MLKVLIWVVSKDKRYLDGALNILESQHDGIELVDVAAGEEISAVDSAGVDVILVVGAKEIGMSKITKAARQFNLPEEKLLGDWIVTIPGFTLDKYRRLQRSRLSIISMDCFGGLLSHTLGVPFRSPFANLRMERSDFLTFLGNPRAYLEKELVFKEKYFHPIRKYYYPIFSLGDVSVRMVHYLNSEKAVTKWEQRKPRINWYNLFVVTISENIDDLKRFEALPYGKKICFVPFKSDLDSAWYINPKAVEGLKFWEIVHDFARGIQFYYDPFDMLLYGKKTPLIDM